MLHIYVANWQDFWTCHIYLVVNMASNSIIFPMRRDKASILRLTRGNLHVFDLGSKWMVLMATTAGEIKYNIDNIIECLI